MNESRRQTYNLLSPAVAGVEFVWGDLTPPVYIIGPRETISRETMTEDEFEKQMRMFLEHGSLGFVADINACNFVRTILSLLHGFQNVHYYSFNKFESFPKAKKENILKSDIVIVGGGSANPIYAELINEYEDIRESFLADRNGTTNNDDKIAVKEDTLVNHKWLLEPIFLPRGEYRIRKSVSMMDKQFCTITDLKAPMIIYQDCGVFLKRPNFLNSKRHVFFVAGYRSPGTQAAAAISVVGATNELYDRLKDEQVSSLAVVARIRGTDSIPQIKPYEENRIKTVYPFESGEYLNVASVKITADDTMQAMLPANTAESPSIDLGEAKRIDKTERNINTGETDDNMDTENELEYKIDEILRSKKYDELPYLYEVYGDRALDVLYNKTIDDLYKKPENGNPNGKFNAGEPWKVLLRHYDDRSELQKEIYSRLGEYRKDEFIKEIDGFIKDTIFGFFGVGSPEVAYRLAKSFSSWRKRKRGIKLFSKLGQSYQC